MASGVEIEKSKETQNDRIWEDSMKMFFYEFELSVCILRAERLSGSCFFHEFWTLLFIHPTGPGCWEFFQGSWGKKYQRFLWILKTPGWKEISGLEWDVQLGRVLQRAPWITVCIALDTWRQKFGGGLGEGGTEIIEDKKESDLTVCPRLLTNFVRIVKLFVGTWNFLLTYHFLECFPSPHPHGCLESTYTHTIWLQSLATVDWPSSGQPTQTWPIPQVCTW